MFHQILSNRPRHRELFFVIRDESGTPTAETGTSETSGITDNATGNYNIAFAEPGRRLVGAHVTCDAAAIMTSSIVAANSDETTLRVSTETPAGTATDVDALVNVVLSDNPNEY